MRTIQELALSVATEMTEAGYAPNTAWQMYVYAMLPLLRIHEANGKTYYDADLTANHVRELTERYQNGEMSRGHYYHRARGIDKLTRMHDSGKLLWDVPGKVSKFRLNEYYEQLLNEYLSSKELHPNTRGDVIWATKKFFSWLVENGHENLESVAASEIQGFIVYCAGYMASSSIHDVQLYTRKLCAYLHERGLLSSAYTALLSMKVSRESKMYPAAAHSEIAAVLNQVDRSTTAGKRDYAVILLGAVTGLRAIDVRHLKLTDINWESGELSIVQSKTGKTNVLPLTEDVGSAIQDYILHGRPKSECNNVFIRIYPPLVGLRDAWAVGDIYNRYRIRAGLPREAFDGKGFHSLRRALGKNMITAGVSVENAAQAMGDVEIDSMTQYIALDSPHLSECALDFSGIAVRGGEPRE